MKPFSWKSVTIYLTIILFLILIIQFGDWNKREAKEQQYLEQIVSSLEVLIDFQKSVINGEVEVDSNKKVLTMADDNFQYQLSMFIDIFGNLSEGDETLFDHYIAIEKLLNNFNDATTKEEQQNVHQQLTEQSEKLMVFMERL
ncbi:iron ABC transporter substrate-binding protein [Solibacillus sp. R5-41]|uniref:iron ABC transporter substrate-binding protein n=1 Tax=Solibacillus sp. R5-41 TaxID=2048654 RepID=UPI000C125A3D|nr:iron ABC transporter substrate-binding protein [Solibacillus sp. R5-41]ATP39543.1 iron ABC transporter substrate-binding protein [Solibacillus sp. R5-41]